MTQRETEYACKFYNNLHITEITVYQELSYLISLTVDSADNPLPMMRDRYQNL